MMVRERKTRVKDIEKLHELIDSASLPKPRTITPNEAVKLEALRKRLSDDSFPDHKQSAVSHTHPTAPEGLTPQVSIRKQEEIQKKDERVIQIDLGPKATKKEKEQPLVDFLPVEEDPFTKEPLFEIEKVITQQKKVEAERKGSEKPPEQKEFLPVIPIQKEKEEILPEFLPVSQEPVLKKAPEITKGDRPKEPVQMAGPLKKEKKAFFSLHQRQKNEIPSFEPVESQPAIPEKKGPMRFEIPQKTPEDRKQKKMEAKKIKLEEKQKEKETKHKEEDKETKLKIETVEADQKKQEEKRKKDSELKQASVQAETKEREERRLKKEQEKKSRLELIDRQKKEKEDRKQKKIDEKKARFELKEKKLEAKRLAKEHDRKLKLEWIEFQHTQQQTQKSKDLEKKKAAVEAKEKEREEQQLLKEREGKLRHEQLELKRKEKEQRIQKKLDEKKAKQEAKIKAREEKQLAKEEKEKQNIKKAEAKQKQLQEQKQKEIEIKRSTTQAEEKKQEEQRLLKEMEERSQLELKERQKKENEKQKIDKQKKEKKTTLTATSPVKKDSERKATIPHPMMVKPEKSHRSLFGTKKEEHTKNPPTKSNLEVSQKELDNHTPVVVKEPPRSDTQKQIENEKKREQKRLEKEQKEETQRERLELKKKEKEQRLQKKLEEKQRNKLFKPNIGDSQQWKQSRSDEMLSKKQKKEKEREAQRLLKEQQKRNDRALALKEFELKEKEKKEWRQKLITTEKDKEQISRLSFFGKEKNTELIDDNKQAEQQKQTMALVRIAAEEKELRKTKTFERKMQKEQKKREKEEQKYKLKEEEKAKKHMDVHMQEEMMKEKMTNPVIERTDPFVAFDSINQEIAGVLSNSGYTTVEKLRQATIKDLMRTGLKKKEAQKIIAECTEFVEWQVFDSIDHF
jgi:hypothetical protein